jgi:hypothetical protein
VRSTSKKKPALSNQSTISPPNPSKRVNGFFTNMQNLEINATKTKNETIHTASSRAQSLTPRNLGRVKHYKASPAQKVIKTGLIKRKKRSKQMVERAGTAHQKPKLRQAELIG